MSLTLVFFYWVLMESTEDISVWSEFKAAEEPAVTYGEALRSCLAVLEGLADLRAGPRAMGEDEDASPVG